ncbi:hypothetical protein NPIL_70101 [Nephila pilipes]|uniref:Uncharacterized protein n=1 Tax=Nephila pilipes TaxID=299642 RepID=A0A8X6Q1L8_NEPPI|nr:hypothetical protein NPIL_242921 [Nephila pilipes]GFT18544.1 hypothetical protein NPIL_345741 [Nephila pilipes]GFU01446.1 hypothetical protein NPIL_344411 [Nephila pilipes]GFU40410.1 hypothetical protein NPIL_70101 [Nephila pilipes]
MASNIYTSEALSAPNTSSPAFNRKCCEENANGESAVNPATTTVGPMIDSLPMDAFQEVTDLFFAKHAEGIKMLIKLRDAYNTLWAKRLSIASNKNPEEFPLHQAHSY